MLNRIVWLGGMALVCAPPAHASQGGERPITEGRLAAREGRELVDVPLKHTGVRIRVSGHLADVSVEQTFQNPYPKKIDAVYLFPLPTGAAVSEMELLSSGRRLRGTIHPREDARRIYTRARRKGQVAALLTEERPNLFTQSVANLEPGAEVVVRLRYVETLFSEAGSYELVFPMVAGPRYLPRQTAASTDSNVQPAVLPPGLRSSHDIALSVELEAGVPARELRSPSHRIVTSGGGASFHVELAPGDTIPNKDFILRWEVAGVEPAFALLAHRDEAAEPGSFFLLAQPPLPASEAMVPPRELIFVVDTSSSMAGAPLAQARQLVRAALAGLRQGDTFSIVRFDDQASALGPRLLSSKARNVAWAREWLDALPSGGGTEMVSGLRAALELPHDPARLRVVVFLTDGYIGNEDEVLALVAKEMGAARLFSFGVGSAVNRYLLEEMARLGRGVATVVRPDEDAGAAVAKFHARIDRPVLTDLSIDWGGLAAFDVVPAAVPDLFAGQPLVLAGHYRAPGSATVTVRGRSLGRELSFAIPVTFPERDVTRPAVPTVWARARIAELSRRMLRGERPELVGELLSLALKYHLMTPYTAFVVVDESHLTRGGPSDTIAVPVVVPEGVRGGMLGHVGYGVGGSGYGYGMTGTIGLGSVGHGSAGQGSVGYGSAGFGSHLLAAHRATAPAVEIQAAGVEVRGSLDKTIIRRVIRSHWNEVRFCYEKELARAPELAGRVEVRFLVRPTGAIAEVTIPSSTLPNAAVGQCIVEAVQRWSFPSVAEGGITVITYPFVFRPSEAAPTPREPVEVESAP